MNPRAVALWAASGAIVALVTGNPVYRGLALLVACNVLLRLRLPDRRLGPLFLGTAAAAVAAVALNVMLAHTGDHALVSLPGALPGIGGPLTIESAAFGTITALGLAAAVLFVGAVSYLVEPEVAVDALPRALERTGTAIAAALALIPTFGRSFRSVREAQLARGWRPRGPRSWADVLVPVVLTSIEDSVQLAEAMEARAFGSGPRSRLAPPRWKVTDGLVAAAALLAALVMVGGRLSGLIPDWYPYPALSAPPVSAAAAAACLLLAAPLMPWRASASSG